MNRTALMLIIVVLLFGWGALLYMNSQNSATTTETMIVKEDVGTMTVTLAEENDSGQSGVATLVEDDGVVTVTIAISGFTANTPQPAHIHIGSCPDVGAVKYPLTNVVDGESVTVLETTLAQLRSELPLGLNVHKSAPEASVYTACGDLN